MGQYLGDGSINVHTWTGRLEDWMENVAMI